MEVRDPLTSELLSILRPDKPTGRLMRSLAYSPDGRSICGASDTTITIWDIQTGGVAKEIDDLDHLISLAWSSDGRTIGAILRWGECTVVICDVASGESTLRITFGSVDPPHLWTHGKSFRLMTTHDSNISQATVSNPQSNPPSKTYRGRTINILEVPALTQVRSFHVSVGVFDQLESFSPISHHASFTALGGQLLILDDRNLVRLSKQGGGFPRSHCFSSDGNFFAAFLHGDIHVWKYSRDLAPGYTPWRKYPVNLAWGTNNPPLRFSPTSSSISGSLRDDTRVWHLDDLPTVPVANPNHDKRAILSPHGNYIITTSHREGTVTITNLRSQTPPQLINTSTPILELALVGNILWVVGLGTIVAWRLTEEGQVDGVPNNGIASRSDSIQSVSSTEATVLPEFFVKHQTGFIVLNGTIIHTYHTGSGEEVEDTRDPFGHWCSLEDTSQGQCYLYSDVMSTWNAGSFKDSSKVWAGDPEVRRRLWLPIEWRIRANNVKLFHDIGILQLELPTGLIIIRF